MCFTSIIQMNNFRRFERARMDCIFLSFKEVLFCHQLLLCIVDGVTKLTFKETDN